jgi:hypothetical protein
MTIKPLWPLALLALLYWEAPTIVPYAVKLARVGTLLTTILILPALIYASLFGRPSSVHISSYIQVFADLAYLGMFIGFTIGAVCFFVDAKRRP